MLINVIAIWVSKTEKRPGLENALASL